MTRKWAHADAASRRFAAFAVALPLICACVLAPSVQAQGVVRDKHGDWETRCETPPGAQREQCAVVISVVAEDRPNVTIVLIALITADRKTRLVRVIAPLGVLLPTGVTVKIDSDDFGRLVFARCLPNGCLAEVVLDDKLLDRMKSGKTMTLGVFQSPEEGIGVAVPLSGFKEGFEALP